MDGQKFDFTLGVLYIMAQSLGAASAALLQKSFAVNDINEFFNFSDSPFAIELYYDPEHFLQACVLESIGAFILVFMWLSTQNK